MSKILLALGLVAALAAPASAGRLDVDPAQLANPSQSSQTAPAVDVTVTRSISGDTAGDRDVNRNLFGPNSR
ncbi:MAG TPA: hypothetical protein VGN97_19960 [Mesorhizobium sp.]|jgi:ABC-type glycerol-3-phosphate transport system substrate-binding protein|nr:hypothetical protein [Mesorhizobium sp.]